MAVDISKLQDKHTLLDDLMLTYGQDVWNFAFSITRRRDLADDITQDVFIKTYKKIDSFRGQSSIKTWMLSITRNVARDYQRSAFFRKVTLVEYMFERESHPSAEKEALDELVAEDVWRTVLQLPPKPREVLVLYGHHQLSLSEISALLGISEGTVKSRLHRARAKISTFMREGV